MSTIAFHSKVIEFLDAVKNKNFEMFQQYLSPNLTFMAILPGGKIFSNSQSFVDSQRSYFKSLTGRFVYQIHTVLEADSLGFCSIWADYSDIDSQEKAFHKKLYISFLFQKMNDSWFLIHDQNTEI